MKEKKIFTNLNKCFFARLRNDVVVIVVIIVAVVVVPIVVIIVFIIVVVAIVAIVVIIVIIVFIIVVAIVDVLEVVVVAKQLETMQTLKQQVQLDLECCHFPNCTELLHLFLFKKKYIRTFFLKFFYLFFFISAKYKNLLSFLFCTLVFVSNNE